MMICKSFEKLLQVILTSIIEISESPILMNAPQKVNPPQNPNPLVLEFGGDYL